jgi:mono/diheme cytochrome c family protein
VPLALNGWELGLLASAVVFISFALLVALVIPRFRPGFPGRGLGWFIGGAIVLFAVQLTAVLLLASHEKKNEEAAAGETTTESSPTETGPTQTTSTESGPTSTAPAPGGQGNATAGKQIFMSQPCGSCHTLKDAGTSGTVGPNLDQLKPPEARVQRQVINGGGAMPAFKGTLTPAQITAVSKYVSSVAGK